jgi:enoyl-CoA hydratase
MKASQPADGNLDGPDLRVKHQGNVALVWLKRDDAGNPLGYALVKRLTEVLVHLETDRNVRVVVLWGGEKAFAVSPWPERCCSPTLDDLEGAEFERKLETAAVSPGEILVSDRQDKILGAGRFPKPTIAAVCGRAIGEGAELALGCDLIVCSPTAVFSHPEVFMGVIPGSGATQRLTRAVGAARAAELIMTGRPYSGREAHSWGLVNRLAAPKRVLPEALKLAQQIAALPPLATRAAKQAVAQALEQGLGSGLRFERTLFASLLATQDMRRAMRAIARKTKPEFEGN